MVVKDGNINKLEGHLLEHMPSTTAKQSRWSPLGGRGCSSLKLLPSCSMITMLNSVALQSNG